MQRASRLGIFAVVFAVLISCAVNAFSQTVDSSTASNKFILGYQGWHMCQGDGNPIGQYIHWSGNDGVPSTTNGCVDDIWPDLSEFSAGELFPTGFTLGNGQAAKVYSDYLPQTCDRHFSWMQQNGIDGVFAQRFTKDVFQDANWTKLKNQIMTNVMNAAQSYGRVFCVEYDISNDPTNVAISHLTSDWAFLSQTMKITNSARYLKHRGKPLVGIFGLGFVGIPSTGAEYSPGQALTIISNFHAAGCSVMGGVPYAWHILTNDALSDTNWLTVYKSLDIISPWAVGRYQNTNQMDSFRNSVVTPDLAYCNANGMDYMPVILPGYSAANLGGNVSNSIARIGGKFYWRQAYDCMSVGCNMLFGAMFDEIDEGTAIYKLAPTTSTLPQYQNMFALNVDGYTLPSDWYLRVAGAITKTVHKQNPLSEPLPISPSNSIAVLSPNGGEMWRVGAKAFVNWSTTGQVSTVKIDLSTDGGVTWSALAYGMANTGSATVLVPNVPGTNCWVRVADVSGSPTAWSATNFTIAPVPNFRPAHLQPLWSLAPRSRTYLPTDTSSSGSTPLYRSLAYNAFSNQVIIVSRTGSTTGLTVNVLDATSGADLYQMSTSGISGGNIVLLSVAVADDGAVYAANMSSSGTGVATYKLYRWPSTAPGIAPMLVFSGEPAGRTDAVRWGDTLAVRGSGTNTQILIDCQSTNVCALLTPNNGNMNSWVSTAGAQDYTGSIGRSLQFGPTNTFWQKRKADRLEVSTFATAPGSFITSNSAMYYSLPSTVGLVGIDFTNNVLVALNFCGNTNGADTLDLYDVSNLGSPALLARYSFPITQQPNPNWIGQIVFGGGKVFAIDGNNGVVAFGETLAAQPDMRFDIATFCCTCTTDDHFCFPQFDHLNWVSTNGHYLALGSDNYRANVESNGNVLAAYYDTFTTGFSTNTAQQKADSINQYVTNLFTTYGPRPDWLVLNEISSSQWPNNDTYRQWTTNVVHILATTYGYHVVIYSPFPNPGTANAVYWQAIANDGYIGVENYLSGKEIADQNFSVAWCQSQYQVSTNNYGACGVPLARLILGEHFACNTYTNSDGTTNNWGRAGASYDDWDKALVTRSKAALNVGFPGFASYAWAKNGMLVSDTELIHFEDTYRTNFLPAVLPTAPAALVTGPLNATNTVETTATFAVNVSGTTPIDFQWQQNGTNLTDSSSVNGAVESVLTLSGLTAASAGTYTVLVGNAASNFQTSATLTMLLPPTVTTQPSDTTVSAGGTAVFTVAASGTGPFSYQWRKAGVPLANDGNVSGALSSALTIAGATSSDAASYSVVISNNYGGVTSSNSVLSVVYRMPFYEPFAYTAGSVLGGQMNSNFLSWTEVGTNVAGGSVAVQSGNLSYAGLPASVGNQVQFGGLGKSARLSFPAVTNGTLYYSHLFKVTNLTGFASAGVFVSGFNNSAGAQGTTPSVVGTRLYLRSAVGGYNVGVAKNDSTAANWVWDPRTFTTNDTLYIVGSYTFGTVANTSNDVCKLWINPAASDLGAASPSSTPLIASAGTDIASDQIASFVILQRSTAEPAGMLIDELRIDTTWAEVTGSSATSTMNNNSNLQLLNMAANPDGSFELTWGVTSGTTYHFQYTSALSNAQWTTIGNYVATSNTLNVVDGPLVNATRFYRLTSTQSESGPAGLLRFNAPGNSDTFVSVPFTRPGANMAIVSSVNSNVVTVVGSPFTANQFVYASGTQSNTYYARFTSGAAEGRTYQITTNDVNSLTFGAGSLNGVSAGDGIAVEAYWTLNTVFPNGSGVNISPTAGNRNTEVLIPDVASTGINLSATKVYFFNAGIWKQVGQGTSNHNDDALAPNSYFIVRHNVSTNTMINTVGNVVTSRVAIVLQTQTTNQQDNSVALLRPGLVSLNDSGLIGSGAFAASPLPGGRTDELLTFDNLATNRNKSASAVYYYWNNAWRQVGAGSTDVGTNQPLGAGAGFIIRKGTNSSAPVWTNAPNY